MSYYRNFDRRKRTLSDLQHVVATVLICLFCWVTGYIHSTGFPLTADDAVTPAPLWTILLKWINNKQIAYILGLLLIILTAFIIQRINDIEMLIRERTRLVFMIFFILSSTNNGIIPFNNVTIVLLCLALMIYELFNTFQMPEARGKLFDAGVYIGVAGLFMPQALWFLPLLWLGMYQLLSMNYKSFMASLLGVLTVYWLVLAWCVWRHDFTIFYSLFTSLTEFQLFSIFFSLRYSHLGFFLIVFLMIPVFINIKMDAINNRLRVRQMLSFLLNMSIWSFILICLFGGSTDAFLSIFYLPLTVLMAYFFEKLRRPFHFLFYYLILAVNVFSFLLQIWNH